MRLDWKKGIAALVLLIIVLGLYIAFNRSLGNPTEGVDSKNKESSKSLKSSTNSKYPVSLSYWVAMDPEASATMKSYNELGMYKQLEKITGTKVQFQHPPLGQ